MKDLELLSLALTGGVAPQSLDAAEQTRLFKLASHHGVLGLFPIPLPSATTALYATRARGLRALKFTRRVVDVVTQTGIPVVVMKGAAAASRWPDATLRQQSDIDILVERRHKDATAHALVAAGIAKERFLDSHDMHNDSLSPADPTGMLIEVHHALTSHHDVQVDVSELIARRVQVTSAQGPLPALSPEDDAVYLALHAATHALTRLAWLVDLACLRADWNCAAARAVEWNVAPAVHIAWQRTRQLLAAPIPEGAFKLLAVSFLQRTLVESLQSAAESTSGELNSLAQRSLRLGLVPIGSIPRVLRKKLRARAEETRAYEAKR